MTTEHSQNKPLIYESRVSAQGCVLMFYFAELKELLGKYDYGFGRSPISSGSGGLEKTPLPFRQLDPVVQPLTTHFTDLHVTEGTRSTYFK
jgi:hypothetical protein